MDIRDIIDASLAVAIQGKLTNNPEFFYRKICRSYSKNFNTPLSEVMEMAPYDVMLSYFEESIDNLDLDTPEHVEEILDRIYTILDPSYSNTKEEEIQDFIKHVETLNDKKIEKNKPKEEPPENSLLEKQNPLPQNLPKGGMINLEYLAKLDNESGGFED
jgi:hypothetical protein